MEIESTSSVVATIQIRRVQSQRDLQSVFSDVLAEAGREGFRSAEPTTGDAPTSEEITNTWKNWLAVDGRSRYRGVDRADQKTVDQSLDTFNALLIQAVDANAYAAPEAFLGQLDASQLSAIQQVHHLAQPINVDQLNLEGSLNLLLPPPAQVDLDNDGLTQSGVGQSIRFPDSRTPPATADAWYEATASLSSGERAIRELQMKVDVLFANIHLDAEGRFSHRTEPGDPDWVNPMASPDYSYVNKTRDTLASIEYFKSQTPPAQYARDLQFWSEFQSALVAHGAS